MARRKQKLMIKHRAVGDLKSRAKGRSKEKPPFKTLKGKGRRKR